MPHKHTRPRQSDGIHFDLAPSQIAKPLAAFERTVKNASRGRNAPQGKQISEQNLKRKRRGTSDYKEDDTPRAFARLMQQQAGQRLRSGLDNGDSRKGKGKRRKTEESGSTNNSTDITANTLPLDPETGHQLRIQPGEGLADFAARVNQALPVGGLARKGNYKEGPKERQTKTEKRLHRMYAEWREEEARRKEKLEEMREKQEEENEEKEAEYAGQSLKFEDSNRKKKRKLVGEIDDSDEDPWAVLKTRRDAPKGLNDVVQAPPTLKVIPKEKFKVRNGAKVDVANVPGAAGSLKRREELGQARSEVIQRYRAMMKTSKPMS